MTGIKHSANRPKMAKHLRTTSTKRFRNDDPEAKGRYQAKMAARAQRKLRRKGK
jgi:hypothetical protein